MGTRPWMPLYIADYLKKTTHLGALESGAYLHLIMDYWQNGTLPAGDRQLARVAKLTDREWKKAGPVLMAFFTADGKHTRIDEELAKVEEVSSKRRASAMQRHSKKDANAYTLHTTHSEPKGSGAVAPIDPKAEYFRRGREIFGPSSGGLLSKLLKSFGNEDDPKAIALARARIEDASTKAKPAEWIGRVMAPKPNEFKLMSGQEGVV